MTATNENMEVQLSNLPLPSILVIRKTYTLVEMCGGGPGFLYINIQKRVTRNVWIHWNYTKNELKIACNMCWLFEAMLSLSQNTNSTP